MKCEPINFETVIEAFSFVVSIDNIDYEAWNNLGAAHLHLKNYKSALYALSEAGNLRQSNWKIWENVLTAAMKLKKLSKSISALVHLMEIKKDSLSINTNVIAALTIELTAKIQQFQSNDDKNKKDEKKGVDDDESVMAYLSDNVKLNVNEEKDEVNDLNERQHRIDEDMISKRDISSLIKQFDALITNILHRINENSFCSESSHEHSSPFTQNGLKSDSMMNGMSMNKRAKQTQSAYDIYEIFAIYFEKTMRCEESIETRFKQSRMMMKYFEFVCKSGQSDKMKGNYEKIVHVLDQLMCLYAVQIEKGSMDIQKMQEMLTSIQLTLNRAQRLSGKMFVDVKESKELMDKIQTMEAMTYKIKNDAKSKEEEKEKGKETSITSAFADWM